MSGAEGLNARAVNIIAIIFLETIERRALARFADCPLFLRYVDDCYALVSDAAAANQLLVALNQENSAIKFTLERPTQDGGALSLSLLDLAITIDEEGSTSYEFYSKAARSDLLMHRDSALPWNQKAATFCNEAKRVAERCTSGARQAAHRAALESRMRRNGYSTGDLRRMESTGRRRRTRTSSDIQGPFFYLDFPYLGDAVEQRVRRLFQREGINIRLYRRSTSLLDVLRPRQPEVRRCPWPTCPTRETATCFTKNCVYQIKCVPCRRRYIGSTTRALHERVREHTIPGRSSLIFEHLRTCGNGSPQVEVSILTKEKDAINTRLAEAMKIRALKPELNSREEQGLEGLIF